MAIDPSIALGIRPLQLADPLAQYSQFAQIQNAQNQNALAQYQLGAAQRAEAKDVARTNALMAVGSDEDAIANALLKIGDVTGYSALIKAKEEKQKTRLEKNKLTNEIVDQRLKQSRSFLDTLDPNDPNIAPKLKGWNLGNHADEYLGPLLKSFGATTENSTAEIDNVIAGGPAKIEEFLNRSRLVADKFADFMQRQNEVRQITGGVQAGAPPQMGAPSAAAMPASALSTVAPSVAAPLSRINFVKSQIDHFSNVLSANPSNKLAADRLQALTTEYNQLSAEQDRSATLEQRKLEEKQRKLEAEQKNNLEMDKFNASQKEFKVEKTPQGLVQINKDGKVSPILGADGKQVQSLEFAKSEIKTNADGNYIAFNPYTNESRIITGADGKPVRSLEAANAEEQKRHNQALENKDPEAIRTYLYAKEQGYEGTYTQWLKDKATWERAPAAPSPLAVLQAERDALPFGDPRRNEYEKLIAKQIEDAPTNLAKLQAELAALPLGDPRRREYERLIAKEIENAPTDLARLQAERDALTKKNPKDPLIAEYNAKIKQMTTHAPGTNVSVINTPTAKSLSEPVGKLAETSLAKAQGAAESMESANQIRKALNAGNVIAGPLAGARTKFAQVLEMAGVGDKEKLANTRNAIQGLASMTLASRGDLRGQGQITDMETKLLERAKSADIGDLTIGELHQIVNTAQKVSNRLWSNHQTLLKTMENDPEAASARKYYAPTGSIPEALGDQTSSKPDGRKPLANIFGQKK
jgi:hypothetical protein